MIKASYGGFKVIVDIPMRFCVTLGAIDFGLTWLAVLVTGSIQDLPITGCPSYPCGGRAVGVIRSDD
ncbi:MAG: hypothetical protein B7Y73_06610 [Acidocella sp. 35-58-6]|nr:MAG: hypothetical protein B7Z77_05910 [Acidocella sp. 20-58-15]OYY03515.1 MAG: hypothetical protein B7Y73_06610 [Acidocella sp. 35-58-6]